MKSKIIASVAIYCAACSMSLADEVHFCTPHDPPPPRPLAPGLRALPSTDYKGLCEKKGITCTQVQGKRFNNQNFDCFVMRSKGKIDTSPPPDKGPEGDYVEGKFPTLVPIQK